jgi:hypothetical protein
MNLRSKPWPFARLLVALGASVVATASCHDIDTARVAPKKATLGDDIYGVFCDRVGASSLPEDLSGYSYSAVCHYDDQGRYADKVDTKALPPPSGDAQKTARSRAIAKVERMAQRRSDVIQAINAIFPADVKIPDLVKGSGEIGLHDALFDLAQTLTPLYESTPFDPKGEALLPSNTRALGKVFDAFGAKGTCAGEATACSFDADCGGGICEQGARGAMSRAWSRRGYRPFQVGMGMMRPALAYPDLRKLTTTTLALLGPGGAASAELQQVLTTVQQELFTATNNVSQAGPFTVDPATLQPNRPREDMELVRDLFLTEDPAFAVGVGSPFLIARRDRRGFVVPEGNVPGMPGTVPAPFSDLDNDGLADVDAFGRFIDTAGAPVAVDLPFAIPGITTGDVDPLGRPVSTVSTYQYVDTSKTLLGGLVRHLTPLLDPTILAAGDPNAWQSEHETAMYALAGAKILFGEREDATYDYGKEGAGGKLVNYRAFKADESPIPDLIHAVGQILADPDSDAILESLTDLMQNHEQVVARLMGAALRIREISKKHDDLAAQGVEPKAELAYEVTLWDEMAAIVAHITQVPGLLENLVKALADDSVVTQQGNADHMGYALSWFMTFRDRMTYNKNGTHQDGTPGGINGPAVNLTISPGGGSIQDPQTLLDWNLPQTLENDNLSLMQRSLQLIHDANGGPACNKDGARVNAKLGPISLQWPLVGAPYTECELFEFKNLGIFYLNSMLPAAHPKRSFLEIKSSTLNGIMSALGALGQSPDDMLQQSSDIVGLTLHPSPNALNRLVWFGATTDNYPGMPDSDSQNANNQVNKFVHGSIEPVSAAWCPKNANGVPTCTNKEGTMRVRNKSTIFVWERFGFQEYLKPMIQTFANVACTPNLSSCDLNDFTGEKIFMDLFELLNKHWPGPDHGSECKKGDPAIPCAESGLNRYQPLLGEAFLTDIIPALHEFAKVAVQLSKITVKRGPKAGQVWTGAQVLEKLTRILMDDKYAESMGMLDRKGQKATTWVDGTPRGQVTPYSMFADALHGIDLRFDNACDCAKKTGLDKAECERDVNACRADAELRRGQWKRARSQLVDEFLAVDGEGAAATFKNPTVVPTLIATMRVLREQLNANCPERETSGACQWARHDLASKLAGVMSRPLFAAIVDMQDQIRKDEGARRQLETFLQYALSSQTDGGAALQGSLAALNDILQTVADDATLAPILSAASVAATPASDPGGPGAADLTIKLLKALTDDKYDRYHVMDYALPRLVTPMNGTALSPIEVLMDAIADVNRIDASSDGPMATDDYQGVMSTMRGFMLDKTRGLEQLYTIIQDRPKP